MSAPNYISYKDSAARVVLKDGLYYRVIFNCYTNEYDHLMQSGLYEKLVAKGLIIAHTEIPLNQLKVEGITKVYKILQPEQIIFQGYPFEWSYSQWKKAINAYLQINLIAIEFGMILKDATPYNFYMQDGNAIMLDTSSFCFFKEGGKWNAYRAFCSEFLSPLTLMHYNGQRWSRITRTHLRGLPLNFVSKQLPCKSWFHLNTLLHIHLHARYTNTEGKPSKKSNTGFSVEKLKSLIGMMQSSLKCWKKPYQFEKHWLSYYEQDIASEKYLKHKEEIIEQWMHQLQPKSVLDLGANTGRFSFIAAKYASRVIALESDDICVDTIEAQIKNNKNNHVYPLLMDLAETTPNLGALNKELTSIYSRANSQLVMGLALIHHLHISNQLSFMQIAEMFAMFCDQYLVAEFIPITDSKVQLLIKDRNIDLGDYDQGHFMQAMSEWFTVKETITLNASDRVLILFEKRTICIK